MVQRPIHAWATVERTANVPAIFIAGDPKKAVSAAKSIFWVKRKKAITHPKYTVRITAVERCTTQSDRPLLDRAIT
jgi:hypothetical protein